MRGNEIMEKELQLQEVNLSMSLQKVSYPYFQGVFPVEIKNTEERNGIIYLLSVLLFAFYALFYMFPHFPTLPLFISFRGIR